MEPASSSPPARGGIQWTRLWPDFLAHFRRGIRPDYAAGVASPAERDFLATSAPAVRGAAAQDYVSWRRSALWVGAGLLAISAVIGTIDWIASLESAEEGSPVNAGVANFLGFVLLVGQLALPIAALLAVRVWWDLRASHRRARTGWWIGFAIPFAAAMVPSTVLFQFGEVQTQEQRGAQFVMGMLFAVIWFLKLMPAVLSVLAGCLRAGIAVKQFAPESAIPGWIVAVAAPFAVLLGVVVFVIFNQVGGNPALLIGFGFLVASLLVFALAAGRLARPHSREEMQATLSPLRRRAMVLAGLGSGVLLVAGFTMELLPGQKLVAFSGGTISVLTLAQMVVEFYGRALFTTVVFGDLLVALLRHAWHEAQAFRASELSGALEDKVRQVEDAGVATLGRRAPGATPPSA